jgi:hypothetical protein
MVHATFTTSPALTGYVYATEFTFTNSITAVNELRHLAWNLGDRSNLIYNKPSVNYTFKQPGVFNVTLTAVDLSGNRDVFIQPVSVELAHRDYVYFSQIPEKFALPGKKTEIPFKVKVLSTQINNPIVIDLFCTNSKSIPYEYVSKQWAFLNPTWRFTDENETVIKSLSVVSTPIYKDNKVVALSGEGSFYFIDSTSIGNPQETCPLLISCTLQTSGFGYPEEINEYNYPHPSYANNKNVRAVALWHVNDLQPDVLKVTSNYIYDVNNRYWKNIPIPVTITLHGDRSKKVPGAASELTDIIFTYPPNNSLGKQTKIDLRFSNLQLQDISVDEDPLYFQLNDENNFRTGGYIFTTVTPKQTAISTTIQASAIVYPPEQPLTPVIYPYPGPAGPNNFVWVSSPKLNTLNKINLVPYPSNCPEINYFKNENVLFDGDVREVQVPGLSSTSTFNYNMSGFSGIYGMAIDPADYSLVACDAELDRLYRFSYRGELLKTLSLSTLEDYNPSKKMLFYWGFTKIKNITPNTNFYLRGSYFLSSNSKNYIVLLGGAIQSPNTYQIDVNNRNFRFLEQSTFDKEVDLEIIEIFHPLLPSHYIDSLQLWVQQISSIEQPQFTFNLHQISDQIPLKQNPNNYIVALDGILQNNTSYAVNPNTKTITFANPVSANITVQVLYVPGLTDPATWSSTIPLSTNLLVFPLTGNSNYIPSTDSEFIINIGGVYQPPTYYTHDPDKQEIVLKTNIPAKTPINITQVTVSEIIDAPAAYTPSNVTLDKNSNIWVTLFNAVSVLKFDRDFNLLLALQPSLNPDSEYQFDGDFLLKPPVATTDKDSNCWVTYSHPLCCALIKYSEHGEHLATLPLPDYSVPVDLAIDVNNNIWVSNSYNVLSADGFINLYNTKTLTLETSLTGIPRPSYITLDAQNNIWFTHSINGLGYYNFTTNSYYLWEVNNNNTFVPISTIDYFRVPETYVTDETLGGLSTDVYNRVWVINSNTNTVNIILTANSGFTSTDVRSIVVRPNTILGYYVDLDTKNTITLSSSSNRLRQIQAFGDWTGNKWYQKYITSQNLSGSPVAGTSTPFTIYEFTNDNNIARINETFNTADYYKTLALPEPLRNNPILWDKFFAAAVGNAELSSNEDIGQVVYEKIANFVINHADVDTCNIKQLLSLAQETNVPALDYVTELPTEILRMLDIASVSKEKLWGIPDQTPLLPQSAKELLNPYTTTLTAGTKIVLRSKNDSTYTIYTIPIYKEQTVYPLSTLPGYGFAQPLVLNYQFYTFEPVYVNTYIENIIDWDSHLTTLNPATSTYDNWVGDGGILESSFNYLLTKNLFLK